MKKSIPDDALLLKETIITSPDDKLKADNRNSNAVVVVKKSK